MNTNPYTALENLAARSLETCLQRISRVSAGTWKVLEVKAGSGTLETALKLHAYKGTAAAVYFNLKDIAPLTAVMLFEPADLECISKGFTGHSFPRSGAITMAEEVMLTELANIVLNALINAPLNALKKSFMPAVPLFVQGDLQRLALELGRVTGPGTNFKIIAASISVQSGNCASRTEVFTLLPEELAQALERIQPSA